ncbi:MAG: KamA family radical SAM protein [Phycisphaerae bacterium]|nr:KamA family radical SAM protein [Phycisphaerae bacterium]
MKHYDDTFRDSGYINNVEQIEGLTPKQKAELSEVTNTYRFRSSEYYLSLIDWNNPKDPIRRLIIPDNCELDQWGALDPSGEHNYTIMPGLEHKYHSTALLLVSNVCGGICRYCFRKRVFLTGSDDILKDIDAAIDYIALHPEITNVLLTGGDPLILSTRRLRLIIDRLAQIEHVRIIRIGSKMLAFNPFRVINDPELPKMIRETIEAGKQVYVMMHFNHAQEITDVAREAIKILQGAGAILCNQTPMIRGVNDDPLVLAELFRELSFMGVPPYYIFQCRPAKGNRAFSVPMEEGYQIFEAAKAMVSGLAKRARFVMSCTSGKIEIAGLTEDKVFFKYHRAAEDSNSSKFIVCQRNPQGYWFDDYEELELDSHEIDSTSDFTNWD